MTLVYTSVQMYQHTNACTYICCTYVCTKFAALPTLQNAYVFGLSKSNSIHNRYIHTYKVLHQQTICIHRYVLMYISIYVQLAVCVSSRLVSAISWAQTMTTNWYEKREQQATSEYRQEEQERTHLFYAWLCTLHTLTHTCNVSVDVKKAAAHGVTNT